MTGAAAPSDFIKALPQRAEPLPTVSLIIPTKNEARNVADVLDRLPRQVAEVVFVDTRSSDVTKLMASSVRPDVRIMTSPDPGKVWPSGPVCLRLPETYSWSWIRMGACPPRRYPRFVLPPQHGFDLTKGSRFMAGGGSLDITLIRRLGNRALVETVNLSQDPLHGPLYGFLRFVGSSSNLSTYDRQDSRSRPRSSCERTSWASESRRSRALSCLDAPEHRDSGRGRQRTHLADDPQRIPLFERAHEVPPEAPDAHCLGSSAVAPFPGSGDEPARLRRSTANDRISEP